MSDPNVPLTRAAEDAADAALEAEFARLNPELHRRVAMKLLEVDALRRECARLQQALRAYDAAFSEWERGGGIWLGAPALRLWRSMAREALAGPDTPADIRETCEICGQPGNIDYRGWFDDGSPMRTCNRDQCRPPRQSTLADSQEDKT